MPSKKQKSKSSNLGKRLGQVERMLRSGRERKIARISGELTLSAVISEAKLINLMPDIPQNTTSSGRVGNEIRLKKIVLKSWLRYAPTDVNNAVAVDQANVMARMLIFRQRDQASSVGLTVTPGNFQNEELLESGEFNQGNEFRNIMSPINRDFFVTKQDRKLKLTNNVDGPDANTDFGANPYNFKINNKTLTFGKMGKRLMYSKEAGVVQPNSFPFVYTGGYANCNGTSAAFNNCLLSYDITAYYTDA